MNSKLNVPARVTVFAVLTLLVIAAALTLPKLSSGPVFAQAEPPEAPTALTATAVGLQTVELSWTAPAGTIVGYKIQRSTSTPAKWVDVTENTGNDKTNYSDMHSSLAGKTVVYRVAAINSLNTGPFATLAAGVALPKTGMQPGMPTGLTAMVDESDFTMVELSWSAPPQGDSAITGYTIQRSPKGEQPWEAVTHNGTGTTGTNTVVAGQTWHYRVAATNNTDPAADPDPERGPFSASVSVTVPLPGVPGAPTAPTGMAVGLSTVELSWTAPDPAPDVPISGYRIQRKIGSGMWVTANADTGNTKTHYSDTHSSLVGKAARYRVAAINSIGAGPYVELTAAVTLPKAGTQPGMPTGLSAVAESATVIMVDWTAPAQTGESDITGYTVQQSTDGKQPWTAATGTVTGTSLEETVVAGTRLYFRVAATNTQGTGPYTTASVSATAGVLAVAPTFPTTPVVAVGLQTAELTWGAPASTGTIVGYKIQRSTSTPVKWVDVTGNTGNTKTTYSDTHSSLAGKTVVYQVAAVGVNNMAGPFSTPTTGVALPTTGTQPGMPTGLTAMLDESDFTMVELSWSAPPQGGSAITRYLVQWSKDGEQPWEDITTQPTTTSTTFTLGSANDAPPAGVTRHYRVAAANGADTSDIGPYSASVSVMAPMPGVPGAPTALTGMAVGLSTVELSWTAPDPAPNVPISGYRIQRKIGSGMWVTANADTGNAKTYYSDTHSSLAGKTVVYRVAAINSIGEGPFSANSDSVTLPVAGTQPGAPTDLRAVATSLTTVSVSWTAPPKGKTDITGYTVQYSEKGEQPWMPVSPVHSGLGTTFTETVSSGATRHYRVAASNTQPTGTPAMGPFSDSATAGEPADQMGMVTLSTQEPMVGTAITANLMDDDGGVTGQMWQWQKSMDKDSWMDIMGAMASSYTPVATDEGYYLRATVTYTDENRSGRMAESMATGSMVVPAGPSIPAHLQKYDTNDNDRIEYLELVAVIESYNAGDATYLDLVGVIDLYSAS